MFFIVFVEHRFPFVSLRPPLEKHIVETRLYTIEFPIKAQTIKLNQLLEQPVLLFRKLSIALPICKPLF